MELVSHYLHPGHLIFADFMLQLVPMNALHHPIKKIQSGYRITQLYFQKVLRNPYQNYASRVIKHDRTQHYSVKSKIIACDSAKAGSPKERS